ncbi:MAG TPA: phosphopantetheine-binding protein [Candidatus Angelobacter sp.]|nr:phosphopantetheine-binding protein [Candidatus Angelobacter sp.]
MQPDAAFDEQIISLIASGIAGKFKKVKISRETNLQKELGLDSIGMLALVFRFEEIFGIDIAEMGIEINVAKLKTVADLINAGRDIMNKAQASQVS